MLQSTYTSGLPDFTVPRFHPPQELQSTYTSGLPANVEMLYLQQKTSCNLHTQVGCQGKVIYRFKNKKCCNLHTQVGCQQMWKCCICNKKQVAIYIHKWVARLGQR